MSHIFALRVQRELQVTAPRITVVKRAMVLFSRKYGRACYRDIIPNKSGISKSSAARICLQESTEKKLVKNVTDKTSTNLTNGRRDQEK